MDAAALSRVATVVAQVEGTEDRCTPCWTAAHRSCEGCACTDSAHQLEVGEAQEGAA